MLTECNSKICCLHLLKQWQWAVLKAPRKQELWNSTTKLGGFLSNMASKFHHHTNLLHFLAGFLGYGVCGNLHVSILEWMRKWSKLKPIWHTARPSNSSSNLRWLYQQSWLDAKNLLRTLLKNSWLYFSFSNCSLTMIWNEGGLFEKTILLTKWSKTTWIYKSPNETIIRLLVKLLEKEIQKHRRQQSISRDCSFRKIYPYCTIWVQKF